MTNIAPPTVVAGATYTNLISVTNAGPSVATNVVVVDVLPGGGTTNINVGNLPAGGVTNIVIISVAPGSGLLTNTAGAVAGTSDPNLLNNTNAAVIQVTLLANLGIGKVANVGGALASGNVTYTISVTNNGPSVAGGVVVTDAVPAGVSFVSALPNGVNNLGVVTWTVGTLAVNQSTNVTLTVKLPADAPAGGSVTNVAVAGTTNGVPVVSPPVSVGVTNVADLGVRKSGPAGIVLGANFSYAISVTNFGPSTATGISVTDSLPAGLVFVSSVPVATTNASRQVIWTNLGNLISGATTNLTLTVNSTVLGIVTNVATGGSPVFDPNPTNNTSTPVVTRITNIPPVANPDTYAVGVNTTNSFSVTTNDSVGTPGGYLTIINVSATNGVATIVNGTNIVFVPTHNFSGTATIGYTITNNLGGTSSTLVTVMVGSAADIVVSVTGPANVTVGDAFFYTVVVSNGGPSTAVNTLATNFMPTNLVFSSASAGGLLTNNVVTWPVIPSLTNGQSTNFIVTVASVIGKTTNLPTANPFNFIQTNLAPAVGLLTNRASAFAATFDPNLTNNSASTYYTNAQVQTLIAPGVLSVFVATNTYPTNAVFTNAVTPIGVNLFIVGTNADNPQTGLREENVTVTNIGTAPIHSLRLYVGPLRSGVTLYNATGSNNLGAYVEYDAPYPAPINPYPAANNHVTFQLEFYVTDWKPFTNSLTAVATLASTEGSISGTIVTGNPTHITDARYQSDRFLIEFQSIPGRTYTILYKDNYTDPWSIAVPSIVASANVTQWYDDGPPKTATPPPPDHRFYEVIQNN